MKNVALNLFRITTLVVFIQLLLGGLVTFEFLGVLPHIVLGFIILALAVAIVIAEFTAEPEIKPARMMSIGLLVLLLIQIMLGYATLDSGSAIIAWVHLLNSLLIFGLLVSATVLLSFWSRGLGVPGRTKD